MNFPNSFFWKAALPRFRLNGRGSRKFLQGQTTAEIIHPEGNHKYLRTCWLSPTGRLKALLEVRFIDQDAEVVVLGGNSQKLLNGFDQVIFPSDQVEIQSIGFIQRVQELSYKKTWGECYVEWLLPSESTSSVFDGFQPANKNQIEEWRIRQGLPIGLGELNEKTNPFELGLSNLINLNKGCYLGQETMAKLKNNSLLKQQLRFWEINKEMTSDDTLVGNYLEIGGDKAGYITSSMQIEDGKTIGLALIRRKYISEKLLFIADTSISLEVTSPIGFVDFLI
ncbi:folate-binding protein YgfZ [Prochlorococcus marinus]|uniref:Predicted GcvT-like aminomethyltransferase n=1 Tax=Prochlorococcus marinus (strain MIT 9211) TaxID=93059 RepID=A9BDS4_PROM4|nr:folate-binding protein YgfZ [Prochlorococcus marinus]ABX08234.1 Predicted GcvT-like aminomethyltransferase [Prochlorococcus marinus str. MIT 9211]